MITSADATQLASIITAWPHLPAAIKAAIQSLVAVSTGQNENQTPKQNLSDDSLPWEQPAKT